MQCTNKTRGIKRKEQIFLNSFFQQYVVLCKDNNLPQNLRSIRVHISVRSSKHTKQPPKWKQKDILNSIYSKAKLQYFCSGNYYIYIYWKKKQRTECGFQIENIVEITSWKIMDEPTIKFPVAKHLMKLQSHPI